MENNLFRTVPPKKDNKGERYLKFGFSRNPFPNKPGVTIDGNDERENGSIYISDLRKKEINEFEKILVPKASRSETKSIAFLMDHATRQGRGIGKTSFLNFQRKKINKDLGGEISDNSEVLFALFVSPIPNDNYRKFWTISKLIIDALIDQDILSLAICRIRVLTNVIDPRILSLVGDNLQDTVGDNEWLRGKYKELGIESFDSYRLNQEVKRSLEKLGLDAKLSDMLSRFGCSQSDFRKLFFQTLKDSDWRKNGNKILFDDLIKVFIEAGFTKGLILFDEVEKIIPHLSALERRSFCEELRYFMVDGSNENTKNSFFNILLIIHPYLQELLIPHWEASGLQRFASLGGELSTDYTIFFAPLDNNDAIPLAKAYMDKSKISPNDNSSPFSDEALIEALIKNGGVPGKYLTFLHSAIEKAIDENWDTISVENVQKLAIPDNPIEKEIEENNQLPSTKVKLDKPE